MTESIDIFYDVVVPAFSKFSKCFLTPGKLHFLSSVMSIIAMNRYDAHLVPEIFKIFSKQAKAIGLAILPCTVAYFIIFGVVHTIF